VTSVPQLTALLAPDPALPRRDDLLDGTLVGARLGELWGEGGGQTLGSCTRVRATYRRGESLRATFRIEADPARIHPPGTYWSR